MTLTFEQLHRYEIVSGESIPTADGALHKAMDTELGRYVAIKQVRLAGNTPKERAESHKAALREVRAMVKVGDVTLRTPRIYATWLDEQNGDFFIVMEWLEGEALSKMAPFCGKKQFLHWMADLCEILNQMAQEGIYHKDIKPANIMLAERSRLYLIDFGISLSLPNNVEGTNFYKAPEMDPDGLTKKRDKVDMFSIGVMLYERFTGELPKRGQHYGGNPFFKSVWSEFLCASQVAPDVPENVDEIITRCMKRDPRQRYATMAQLRDALRGAAQNYGKSGK